MTNGALSYVYEIKQTEYYFKENRVSQINANRLKIVLRNVFWLLSERGLQIALALVAGGFIARAFGPDVYGKWQYAISLLFLATTLTYICGAEVIVPKLVREPENIGAILGTAFFIRAVASILGFFVGQVLVYFFVNDKKVSGFLHILLILLLFNEPFGVIIAWFQAKTHIGPIVKARLLSLMVKVLAIVSIFYFSLNNLLVAAAWVGEGFLVMIFFWWIYHRTKGPAWSVDRFNVINFFKEGTAYWIGLLFMSVFLRLDRLFLAEYVGFNQLGKYAAAIQIAENWFVLAGIVSQSIAPRYIYANVSNKEVDKNIRRLLIFYVTGAILGSLILMLLAPLIIKIIFGDMYKESAEFLIGLALVSVGVFVDSLFNTLMMKERAAKWVGMKWLGALIGGLIVNYLFMPSLGVWASIWALYVGYGTASLIGVIYWIGWQRRHLDRSPALGIDFLP